MDTLDAFVRKSALDGFSFGTVARLLVSAVLNLDSVDDLKDRLLRETDLVPAAWETALSHDRLKKMVPRVTRKVKPPLLPSLLRSLRMGRATDEEVQLAFPARTKTDLSIRRTRWKDTVDTYRQLKRWGEVEAVLSACSDWDYIAVLGILVHNLFLSTQDWHWFEWWHTLGAFDADISHYILVTKTVSDLVKKHETTGFDPGRVIECVGAVGYRNLPFPGFDKLEETKKLAEGGGEHTLLETRDERLRHFEEVARRVLQVRFVPGVEWKDFVPWVVEGEWETAGSSSIGKLEVSWSAEGATETKKVKARKNFVGDVVDLEAEANRALSAVQQVNVSISKNELAKVRIAVASDIYTYWKMSWILRLTGHAYLQWDGNTLEESLAESITRMNKMREMAARWNLPFDYASFDHQPETDELVIIGRILCDLALRNVPRDKFGEFKRVSDNVLEGFRHATVSAVDGDKSAIFKVKGGVMSGLRWTTVLGNSWNMVMTEVAREALREMIGRECVVARWVKGDDTAVVANSYSDCLLMRMAYAAVGAVGSNGKFGIHKGRTEFLRQVYTPDRVSGYAARALPGLVQRKPWSSRPWEEESTMVALYDVLRTLRRRGVDSAVTSAWWETVKRGWSRRKKCSTRYLSTPKFFGGLGVEPWDGAPMPTVRWPKTELSGVRVAINGWRAGKLLRDETLAYFRLTVEEAQKMAERQVVDRLVQDDIPEVNRSLRGLSSEPKNTLWMDIPYLRLTAVAGSALMRANLVLCQCDWSPVWWDRWRDLGRGSFGYYRWAADAWRKAKDLERVRPGWSAAEAVLRDKTLGLGAEVRRLVRFGVTRREALNWCLGEWDFGVRGDINPLCVSIVDRAVLSVLSSYFDCVRVDKGSISVLTLWLTKWADESFCSSSGYRALFNV